MLEIGLSVALVVAAVACTVGLLLLFHHFWPVANRREHNDLIGWQISVTGTTYAVVVGFMLYAVWNNYQAADGNAEAEANSIVNVVRSAQGLPEPHRSKIRSLSAAYVDSVLQEEWAAMKQKRFPVKPAKLVEQLWQAVTDTQISSASEQVSLNQTLLQLSIMTEHRRLRRQQAASGIPSILWVVLIVGGLVVIFSACMFGTLNLRVQIVQVFLLSLVLALILLAIADLSDPFQGAVTVSPTGFQQAQATLDHSDHRQ